MKTYPVAEDLLGPVRLVALPRAAGISAPGATARVLGWRKDRGDCSAASVELGALPIRLERIPTR